LELYCITERFPKPAGRIQQRCTWFFMLSVLTSRAGFIASTPFSVSERKQHSDGGDVLLDSWRSGLAPKRLDVGRHRNGLNVFEMLIAGALRPGKELLDRPVISARVCALRIGTVKKLGNKAPNTSNSATRGCSLAAFFIPLLQRPHH
jgi:hypothetical protein